MKYSSKAEYLDDTEAEWTRLWQGVESIAASRLEIVVPTKGPTAWSPRDVVAHLYEWQMLVLGWLKTGRDGAPDLPATGYNWRQTRELNAEFFAKHLKTPFPSIRRRLKLSHGRIEKFVTKLSNSEFIESGHFVWTGKSAVASYIAPNTVSHYRWAQKKIREIAKNSP